MPQLIHSASPGALSFRSMADQNADAPWNTFSSDDYWRRNYSELQAEDQEIIRRVSNFFISAFADRPPAQRASTSVQGRIFIPPC